jgi:hypothetical protein
MLCYFVLKQDKLQTEIAKADQVSKTGFLSLLRRGMWHYLCISFSQENDSFLLR